jgi:hypothetical protein
VFALKERELGGDDGEHTALGALASDAVTGSCLEIIPSIVTSEA